MEITSSNTNREGINLNSYFCASRRRADNWNHLKDSIHRLCSSGQNASENELLGQEVKQQLEKLQLLERYWAFPGQEVLGRLLWANQKRQWSLLARIVTIIARLISTDHYRSHDWMTSWYKHLSADEHEFDIDELDRQDLRIESRPYFEVLVVDSLAVETERQLRRQHIEHRRPEDEFIYNIVVVSTLEDAIISILLNYNIQSCVVRYTFPLHSGNTLDVLDAYLHLAGYSREELLQLSEIERSGALGHIMRTIRPELDLYLLSEATVEQVTTALHRNFRRCFFGSEDYPELRLTILKGIQQRYETPFFHALKTYTQQPTGVFHAMPISRSKSISKSHWIQDYGEFYGDRMFLSETSATTGGLDSLLQPSGSIRRAQEHAATAFGSDHCFFVSNGTSTANKIVLQGIVKPADIIIITNDCHKSHHYAAILADADLAIVEPYQIQQHTIYGGVSIFTLKKKLLELKRVGELHRVRALVLTSLTFDGIAYDILRLMSECLSIKPDLIFFFDEAWFAYSMFTPLTRQRSAMYAARTLSARFKSREYYEKYIHWRESFGDISSASMESCLEEALMPDPDQVRIRVYATQSTHKTLTALRQASMIHIQDQDYIREVAIPLREAYLCHTSTSPNYQILASLDIARRQMSFEGYELVQKAYELALIFRARMRESTLLARFFRALGPAEMIPIDYRQSGISDFHGNNLGCKPLEESWSNDEFALDPSRITLDITQTGMDGRTFQALLMDRFDIQVNKTSLSTVLFIIHIGSTRGMITYLLESLSTIALELDAEIQQSSSAHFEARHKRIQDRLCNPVIVPSFTVFHDCFGREKSNGSVAGNIRKAFYLARESGAIHYIIPTLELAESIDQGAELVSGAMVTPYPPGYPILLPGQVISSEIIRFLLAIQGQEIHGYDPTLGLQVFASEALDHTIPK
ncbi:MAG: hypothetical protein ACOVNL_05160 [Prochlorococcaceae cyanobacterium]|jgi:arginine decarboxylase